MEQKIITFTADQQQLTKTSGITNYASDTISYVKAIFTLGENWTGFDEVRAVFKTPYTCKPAVLDSVGECLVPWEVLMYKGAVRVNLVGSIYTEDEVIDRLTTHSVEALVVDEDVPVCGEASAPLTPSEYEQFVAKVATDANRAEAGATSAETSAGESEASATASAQSATASANSASQAQTYAQNAQNYAVSAETAKDDAIDAKEDAESAKADAESARDQILGMRATANTLAEGSDATASYSNGLLTLGIPRGNTGAKGDKGDKGDTGATPNLSIGTVETLPPTGSSEVTITGTAENPVLNFKLVKGDTGEVTMAQLAQLLPTDTASGDIASFPDGQDVIGALSVLTDIDPIQDLHGYDKPWSGGRKNLLPTTLSHMKTINEGGTWNGNAYTFNGVTFTVNVDNGGNVLGINANGTATADADFFIVNTPIASGTYVLNGCPSGGSTSTYRIFATNWGSDTGDGNQRAFSTDTDTNVRIQVKSGTTASNLLFKPMIRLASVSDATYEPYSNICPISGHTECVTSVSGVNVWDEEWEVGDITDGVDNPASNRIRSKGYISVVSNTTYYLKCPNNAYLKIFYYGKDKSYIGSESDSRQNTTIQTPNDCHFMRFGTYRYGTTYNNDISINYPSTDHEYHAYEGHQYTTSLGRTVYGGTLDVVSGVLTVDREMVDLGTFTWGKYSGSYPNLFVATDASIKKTGGSTILGNAICSQYAICTETQIGGSGYTDGYFAISGTNSRVYVNDTRYTDATAFKTAMNGVQLCYELSTPQTYQLTPTEVQTLLGTNNVWTDCGEVEVTYKADTYLWVEKKLS